MLRSISLRAVSFNASSATTINARLFFAAASAGCLSSTSTSTSYSPYSSSLMCGRRFFSKAPYGSVPSNIEDSKDARRVREEDVEAAVDASVGVQRRQAEQQLASAEAVGAGRGASRGYNPYEVLGLSNGASMQTVRSRYHELMREVHPDLCKDGEGDVARLNQINKAYELVTKSPTLDKRYRNLVSDTQYIYYRFLPEWMARNVDEMPRYWSWVKWRTPGAFQIVLWCVFFYALGRFYAVFPVMTMIFLSSVVFDILFHTMLAPATASMLFLNAVMTSQNYDMGWLTSPKGFLRRDLGY